MASNSWCLVLVIIKQYQVITIIPFTFIQNVIYFSHKLCHCELFKFTNVDWHQLIVCFHIPSKGAGWLKPWNNSPHGYDIFCRDNVKNAPINQSLSKHQLTSGLHLRSTLWCWAVPCFFSYPLIFWTCRLLSADYAGCFMIALSSDKHRGQISREGSGCATSVSALSLLNAYCTLSLLGTNELWGYWYPNKVCGFWSHPRLSSSTAPVRR